jgi:hypothetical protein
MSRVNYAQLVQSDLPCTFFFFFFFFFYSLDLFFKNIKHSIILQVSRGTQQIAPGSSIKKMVGFISVQPRSTNFSLLQHVCNCARLWVFPTNFGKRNICRRSSQTPTSLNNKTIYSTFFFLLVAHHCCVIKPRCQLLCV